MRLFTGIDLPKSTEEKLDLLMSHLRIHAHIKWSPAYNLHITTKFIGAWPPEKLPELDAALKTLRPTASIDIGVRGLGWFPNPHHPNVLFAAIHASDGLANLARATDELCGTLGVKTETRAYTPHLTLARIKEPVPLDPLRRAIAALENVEFGQFSPDRFFLYRSEPGHAGSVYTKLDEYSLAQP